MRTLLVKSGELHRPAALILAGGLVAVPTETVYGLAANGLDREAVAKIFAVKGRPEGKAISLLVSGMEDVFKVTKNVPETAAVLAEHFWPGPLTMILFRNDAVPDILAAGGNTIGVRCPDHADTLEIIRLCGVPLAAPSANLSGEESPKSAGAVLEVFDGKIDAIVDGGDCRVGIESTIIDLTVVPPRILRQGGLPKEAIERALNTEVTQ